MRLIALFSLVILAACQRESAEQKFAGLTPAECREYGVGVRDDNPMTGIIDLQNGRPMSKSLLASTFGNMEKQCGGDWHTIYGGCTVPVGGNHWQIWYADSQCISFHEACHALFQSRHHTGRFNTRSLTGEWLAACPQKKAES